MKMTKRSRMRSVYAFAVENIDVSDRESANMFVDTMNRTVGAVGVHPTASGVVMVYDTLPNAESAWHKFSDKMKTGSNIMHADLTADGNCLTMAGVCKSMRLN